MDLSVAASFFDDTPYKDAYTLEHLGYGQLLVYTEGVRDGPSIRRRVLELAPGQVIPAHLAVNIHGANWIIGLGNFDSFQGEEIRCKYVAHRCDHIGQVATLAQELANTPRHETYADKLWIKTVKEVEEDSVETNLLTIYFPRGTDVGPGDLVQLAGRLHIVKESYLSTAGFWASQCEEIDEPSKGSLVVESKGFTPIYNEPIPGFEVQALRLRWQSDFAYLSQMTPNFERGDVQFVVPAGTQILPGAEITYFGWKGRVINTRETDEVVYVHARAR